MSVIGRAGKLCANALEASDSTAAASSRNPCFIVSSSCGRL